MKRFLRRIVRISRVESSALPGLHPVTVVVRSTPWVPEWAAVRVASAWFATPHRLVVLVRHHRAGERVVVWETTWMPESSP